jgi:HD-GYP domain-containing protein (c-di-GMP phosphodiesterase class II)
MYAQKNSSPSSPRQQTRKLLLRILSERDPDLHAHVRDVTELAVVVGRRLGVAAEELDHVARAAELHDVGKVAIPDAILNKPGPLDDEETRFMRRHTLIGESILNAVPALQPVAKLVRSSHEDFDGHGYPDGLAGEEIPLGARIIAVCDAFHAMTSDRSYRSAVGTDDALAEMHRCAGTQFDPVIVEALSAALTTTPQAPQPSRQIESVRAVEDRRRLEVA